MRSLHPRGDFHRYLKKQVYRAHCCSPARQLKMSHNQFILRNRARIRSMLAFKLRFYSLLFLMFAIRLHMLSYYSVYETQALSQAVRIFELI